MEHSWRLPDLLPFSVGTLIAASFSLTPRAAVCERLATVHRYRGLSPLTAPHGLREAEEELIGLSVF